MRKNLARLVPAGRSARNRRARLSVAQGYAGKELLALPREDGVHQHGCRPSHTASSTGSRATSPPTCRRRSGCARATASRSCCPTCCSIRSPCSARCAPGMTVVNVNPLYTASELAHQLADSGATAIVVLENFARTLAAGARRDPRSRIVITTQVGDLFPPPEAMARQLRREVREAHGARAGAFPARSTSARRSRKAPQSRSTTPASAPTTSPSCSTPAARPASPRARSSPTATWSRTSSRPRPGSAATLEGRRGNGDHRPAALSRLRAHRESARCSCKLGGNNVLITNPRDHRGLRHGAARRPASPPSPA